MSKPDFQRLRFRHGQGRRGGRDPHQGSSGSDTGPGVFGTELAMVAAQEWARRLLVNFRRVNYVGSTGFAALFKLVSRARAEGREVKLCGMETGVRLGAEIVGLEKLVEIHDDEAAALRTFAQGLRVSRSGFPARLRRPGRSVRTAKNKQYRDTNFLPDTNFFRGGFWSQRRIEG